MSDTRIVRRARFQPLHRRAQRLAVAHLVAEPFEVDDERVRRDADRHHEARDRRQRHGEVLVPAQDHHRQVGEQPREQQAGHRHQAEAPVVDEQVDRHEGQPEIPAIRPASSELRPSWAEMVLAVSGLK